MEFHPSAGPGSLAGEAVSAEKFVQNLADSGLCSRAEAQALAAQVAPPRRRDGRLLAQELVRLRKLTRYQALVLMQGRTRGLLLGNYIILDKVGQGGMGIVFKARHRRMERVVAIKVLPASTTRSATAVQRFHREVKATSKLNHANIVQALDADEADGTHFMVMEYVDGIDLSRRVKEQGPLAVDLAVECVLQAARGLEHAHALGIVHRDIKPSNLLLCKGTPVRVKILDMGLARIDGDNEPGSGGGDLTKTGSILGTCDYMAPEQALNTKLADHRADIYSLGCTLYYLLTGKAMYAGDTAMEKLLAHREAAVPALRAARAEVPPALDAVYQRMVAKRADDRPASMRDLIADLERARDPNAKPVGGGGRRRRWLAGGAAAIVAVAALAALLPRGGDEAERPKLAIPPQSPAWLESVARLPAEQQAEAVRSKLRELNPGFDGVVSSKISGGRVAELSFITDHVQDISPVRALPALSKLRASGSKRDLGILADLRPIQGLPLTNVYFANNPQLRDLTPLRGMPIGNLAINDTGVSDLAPACNPHLQNLSIDNAPIHSLAPLRGQNVLRIYATYCSIPSLEPLSGTPLIELKITRASVTDLTPLRDTKLQSLVIDKVFEQDVPILAGITTLAKINQEPAADFLNQRMKK